MKYIENDGQVTREYEVRINIPELENIIKELDEKCYRVVYKKLKVAAYTKEEAINHVNMAINSAGVRVNELVRISEGYRDLVKNPSAPYIFDCDCFYKQSSSLVYILAKIIINYRTDLDYKNQNNGLIDYLIGFANSEELKPFDVRERECQEKIKDILDSDVKDSSKLYSLQEESKELMQEIRLNKNYDFELLAKLYDRAKNCFDLVLVSETIHYKDLDKNPNVYKLGTIKKM